MLPGRELGAVEAESLAGARRQPAERRDALLVWHVERRAGGDEGEGEVGVTVGNGDV